jgi:hypothetical protein
MGKTVRHTQIVRLTRFKDFSQCSAAGLTANLEAEQQRRPKMKTAVRRAADRLTDVVREMNEAQRLMLALRTGVDRWAENPDAAPDTYEEFLARTSGVLLHEAPARKRMKTGRRA